MTGVYKITNLKNNKIYIGASTSLFKRWERHISAAYNKNNKEYDKALYRAVRKYGVNNFSFQIIEITTDIYEREKYWIAYYNSKNNGYNETLGGEYGSLKGHCGGTKNGRALLTEQEVLDIRNRYDNLERCKDVYELYKNKIGKSAFLRVWEGKSYRTIKMEVYTQDNKIKHNKIDKTIKGEEQTRSKWNNSLVSEIRKLRDKGMRPIDVYNKYRHIGSKSSFDDIWYNRNWRDVG